MRAVRVATQYQEELPVQRPIVRAFRVHIGQCRQCHRRVQGRHPLQTSDALGAAAVQLGPQAVALAVLLNKRLGLPYGKIARLLRDRFGLTVTRGGLVHAVHRAARQAQPTYDALCATVRGSPVVTPDETSWRVGPDLQWLWVFVTPDTTVYAIQPGRGLAQAAAVIGLDYAGVLVRDGWQSYRQFKQAPHQTCLAHLLRTCRTLLLDYPGQPFVTAVKALLQAALATRDRYHAGAVSDHGLAVARGHYLERLGALLARTPSRRLDGGALSRPPDHRIRRHLQLPLRPHARRHQLARRARAPARSSSPARCVAAAIARPAARTASKSSRPCCAPRTNAASTPPISSSRCSRRDPDRPRDPPRPSQVH